MSPHHEHFAVASMTVLSANEIPCIAIFISPLYICRKMRRGCNLFLQSEMSHRTTSNQCKSLLACVPLCMSPFLFLSSFCLTKEIILFYAGKSSRDTPKFSISFAFATSSSSQAIADWRASLMSWVTQSRCSPRTYKSNQGLLMC
jgi:hypothetical protein